MNIPDSGKGRGRVSVKGYQLRLGFFVVVSALLCVNVLAPWGKHTAQWIFTALQAGIGAAGCRMAQGHLFGRAVPIGDLELGRAPVSARQHSGD